MHLPAALLHSPPLAFGIPSGFEWVIILVIFLLLFGNRIPGMARSIGSGISEFRKGLKSGKEDPKLGDGEGAPDGGQQSVDLTKNKAE